MSAGRILHVYSGNLYGGVERVLATMALEGRRMPKLEQEFALCFRGRLWDELAAAGLRVHDVGPVRMSRPWTVWRARRCLRSVLERGNFGAVVTHACWSHAVFGRAVKANRTRLVHTVHDVLTGKNRIERWASRSSPDIVMANSRFTADSVSNVFPDTRTEVVYLPVSPPSPTDRESVRSAVRSEFGVPPERVVILQASRLERWKGQAVHIEALGLLRDVPDWEAWFAGGPQKAGESEFLEELKASARCLGIADRVRFLGQRADVGNLMAAADIYCQPNTAPEPFGIVYIEALYAGLPVVASAEGGPLEIVGDSCGRSVSPGDASGVASAIRDLWERPDRREHFGFHGPRRANELCDPARQLAALARVGLGVPA